MKEPNLRGNLSGWLVLALACAITATVVWQLVQPLLVPISVVVVAAFLVVNGLRYWRSKHFW